MNDIIKLAVDTYKGVKTAFAEGDPNEVIRQALVEANGGSTKLSYKSIRDGKANGLFALVEELITETVNVGLAENNPIFNFVDYKNGALGDKPSFEIVSDAILTVSTIAAGTQQIRRQRMLGGSTIEINPEVHAVKIYEEMSLILSGRIDWVTFVNRVAKSFLYDINLTIANAFVGAYSNAALVSPYKQTGSFSEATLLSLIEDVEMATGSAAKVFGTRTALRKLSMTKSGDEVNSDYYNFGFMGKFNGTDCFALKNGKKAGTTTNILNDTDIYVVAGDDKFIKFYTEGDTTIIDGDPTNNAALEQEMTMLQKYGVALAFADKIGIYRLS